MPFGVGTQAAFKSSIVLAMGLGQHMGRGYLGFLPPLHYFLSYIFHLCKQKDKSGRASLGA